MSPQSRFLAAIPDALRVVDAVHNDDHSLLVETYSEADLPALLVTLAAMVDTDRTLHDMLSWATRPGVPQQMCDPRDWGASASAKITHGTRSGFGAGCRGVGCRAVESEYQSARHKERKAKAKAVGS